PDASGWSSLRLCRCVWCVCRVSGFGGFQTRPTPKKDPPLWGGKDVCDTGQIKPGKPAHPQKAVRLSPESAATPGKRRYLDPFIVRAMRTYAPQPPHKRGRGTVLKGSGGARS